MSLSICPQFLPRRRCARLARALSKHRIGSARRCDTGALAILLPACCVVDLATNLDSIHPYEIVRLFRPLRLEVFLADGARGVRKTNVLWDKNIAVFRLLLDPARRPRTTASRLFRSSLIDFAIFDPFLMDWSALLCRFFTCRSPYLLGEIPTPMNTSLGSIWILHLEVPIHMTCLLLFALRRGIEASSACSADIRLCIV